MAGVDVALLGRIPLLKAKDCSMNSKKHGAGSIKQVVSVDSANLEAPSTMTENEAFEKLESLQLENWDELKEQLKVTQVEGS